jgi:NAD(P)-dependent dehydrogenase (short-subunit alcohol dehydrogenase family)
MRHPRRAAGRYRGGLRAVVLNVAAPRAVIITGAFGVLGAAVARRFASEGARLGLIDRIAAPAWALQEFGGAHQLRAAVELTDAPATAAAVDSLAADLGGVDVLVNVAGGFQWQQLGQGAEAVWEAMFATNLKTAVIACSAALPHLLARGGGRIINIGAGAAARAAAGMGAYAASKAGVERLTESLAEELKDRDIQVNSVLPGTLDTPRNRADLPDADFGRWVSPARVADVIAFLASDAARAVTGAAIRVTGRS